MKQSMNPCALVALPKPDLLAGLQKPLLIKMAEKLDHLENMYLPGLGPLS
jgi:hypothetical protein